MTDPELAPAHVARHEWLGLIVYRLVGRTDSLSRASPSGGPWSAGELGFDRVAGTRTFPTAGDRRQAKRRPEAPHLLTPRGATPPEARSHLQRVEDAGPYPPRAFVACSMRLIMMAIAQRHGKLVRHLKTHGAGLGKAQMVGVRRPSPAHETRL